MRLATAVALIAVGAGVGCGPTVVDTVPLGDFEVTVHTLEGEDPERDRGLSFVFQAPADGDACIAPAGTATYNGTAVPFDRGVPSDALHPSCTGPRVDVSETAATLSDANPGAELAVATEAGVDASVSVADLGSWSIAREGGGPASAGAVLVFRLTPATPEITTVAVAFTDNSDQPAQASTTILDDGVSAVVPQGARTGVQSVRVFIEGAWPTTCTGLRACATTAAVVRFIDVEIR